MKVLFVVLSLFAVQANAVTVNVITSNNATISSNTDIAVLDYAQVTSGLSLYENANVYLPTCSNGKVLELKVSGTIDGEHNIVISPSGNDTLESDVGLDYLATAQGSARSLFCKSGNWSYLTYM